MEIYVKRFIQLLFKENEKQNLVSRKAGPEEIEQHVQDSLQLLEWVPLVDLDVIDIGTGAGFPGLILAMACPQSRFTLIESDLKKSGFLQMVIEELGLENVRVIRERAEVLGQDRQYRNSFDVCTNRAVAAMNVVLEYGIPLVKLGGRVFLWKGRNVQQEIMEAEGALEKLGGKIETVYLYKLRQERDRAIVAVEKVGRTPDQYPRRVGAPTKSPL
ncbi:MAG: 16S rRNA (guanine(527)-N(7))-methyltransferase RsmG [Firmicutes bacterium HGW-Firmicutes-15]|nr:MAG: 16S rRNA (guanine(527)-N(7))-methyltransferase RsmG [Firmicutes bacterium HGW-Firmicutes-15]